MKNYEVVVVGGGIGGLTTAAVLAHRGVSVKTGEGFGSGVLTVGGRILAMRSARGEFVVKLPRDAARTRRVAGRYTLPRRPGPAS